MPARPIDALIVDDNEDIRALLTWTLRLDERFGKLYAAAGTRDALQIAAEHPGVAAVVLDQHMPEQCGLAALPRLRQLLPDATIVLYTCDNSVTSTALALGADAVESKVTPLQAIVAILVSGQERRSGDR